MDQPADEDPFIVELLSVRSFLLRGATKLTRNRDDAEDLVQETLIRALKKRHLYKPDTNLPAWLRMMMLRLFYDAGRVKQRRSEVELGEADAWGGNVEDQALDRLEVAQAMADASPVLRMMVRDDLTYEEAAHRLGVKVVTMNGRVYRARQEVRERRREREEGQAE